MFIEVLKFVLHFAGSDSHPQYGDVFKTGSSSFVTIFSHTLCTLLLLMISAFIHAARIQSVMHMPDVFSFPISLFAIFL